MENTHITLDDFPTSSASHVGPVSRRSGFEPAHWRLQAVSGSGSTGHMVQQLLRRRCQLRCEKPNQRLRLHLLHFRRHGGSDRLSLTTGATLVRWFGVVAAIIFTTVHSQDMYDQVGDSMRGRKTVPLVIGDVPARWTIAIPIISWGFVCPCFWNGGTAVLALSLLLAGTVAARSLLFRTIEDDRLTFKMWNAWVALVFVLPLMGRESR